MNNTCNELFLDDVVRVQVYKDIDLRAPIPPTVPNILDFASLYLPDPVLDFAYVAEDILAKEDSINVKQSTKEMGSTLLYIYDIDATIESGNWDVANIIPTLSQTDHHIVLTKSDDSRVLLYGLPHTFMVTYSNTISNGIIKLSISSLNNFINL